jgi:hypothetical protein
MSWQHLSGRGTLQEQVRVGHRVQGSNRAAREFRQATRTAQEILMMSAVPNSLLTPQEYLVRERRAETKSEYLRGEVFAMSGASREHNLIGTNIAAELRQRLRDRDCEVSIECQLPLSEIYHKVRFPHDHASSRLQE